MRKNNITASWTEMECFVVTSDKVSVARIIILTYWRYFIGKSGPGCWKMVIKSIWNFTRIIDYNVIYF